MQTTVTKRGQTVIPASIRKRHAIEEGDTLIWVESPDGIKVIPVPSDPIAALRGRGKNEVRALLAARQADRARE